MTLKPIFYLIAGIFLFTACEESDDPEASEGIVELYLINEYETTQHAFQIDESTVTLPTQPLIGSDDFIAYNPKNHTFTISDVAKEKINHLDHKVHGIAFAVAVDRNLIYTGYFWPGYSSMSCTWVVIDPLHLYNGNELKVQLGYPGGFPDSKIPDNRNHQALINAFTQHQKLESE